MFCDRLEDAHLVRGFQCPDRVTVTRMFLRYFPQESAGERGGHQPASPSASSGTMLAEARRFAAAVTDGSGFGLASYTMLENYLSRYSGKLNTVEAKEVDAMGASDEETKADGGDGDRAGGSSGKEASKAKHSSSGTSGQQAEKEEREEDKGGGKSNSYGFDPEAAPTGLQPRVETASDPSGAVERALAALITVTRTKPPEKKPDPEPADFVYTWLKDAGKRKSIYACLSRRRNTTHTANTQ